MSQTIAQARQRIFNILKEADGITGGTEHPSKTHATTKSLQGNTEAILLLGRIVEPVMNHINDILNEDSETITEVENCRDCQLGHYDDLLPSCSHPDRADDNKTVATEFDTLPEIMPDDCPLRNRGVTIQVKSGGA